MVTLPQKAWRMHQIESRKLGRVYTTKKFLFPVILCRPDHMSSDVLAIVDA